ncbi:MAG: ABC transporter ATP-binding protein [Erysipelotrichaceae bacterium]
MEALIDLTNIRKKYFVGLPNELEVLHGIDLKIYPGEFLAIVGESGSGKSTLMNIIGALDKPTEGEYILNSINIKDFNENEKARIRNKEIGFVFQNFNLIGRSTALKNVELPMLYAKVPTKERIERASELLELVNMKERMHHQPNELSGGQKQRVAIARALSNRPSLILADEPTGALDSETSEQIMKILKDLHKTTNTTVLIITHSQDVAKQCDRIVTLQDGNIISDITQGGVNEG